MPHDQTEPHRSQEKRKAQAFTPPAAKENQTGGAPRERRYPDKPFKKPREQQQRNDRPEPIYISVVIPLLNEEGSLPELAARLETQLQVVAQNAWEVLFIDDGSTDTSFQVIRDLNRRNPRFKAIRFRRNYGKSAALAVGFADARGKYVITMDADLQDDPAEIPALLETLKSGYDLVSGWKKKRYDPISKTLPSKFFNWVTSKASGIKLHDFNCGLKGYRREVVKSLQVYGEMHRYLPALAHWDGFKVTEIPVQHHPRIHGHSKFGASRFLKGFLDLLTVLFTTRYTKRPLHLFGTVGALLALIGFLIDLYLTIEWVLGKTNLSNRPLAIFGIGLIIVGVQLISIGLIAELIVKNSMQNFKYNIQERLY
ncbi:MAG: glycosyltransferase family 2 protein [Bacteroidota bacterium]